MTQQAPQPALDRLEVHRFIKAAGEGLASAQALATQLKEDQAVVRTKSAEIVNALLEHEVLKPEAKEAAVQQLNNHVGAVDLVGNLLGYMVRMKQAYEQQLAMATQGTPYNGQQPRNGGAGGTVAKQAHYQGERMGNGHQSAADRAFWQALGRQDMIRQ